MATLRFVVIPKVVHPWFEEVNKGAQAQAAILSRELRDSIVVDYRPSAVAGIAEQNAILEAAIASRPNGIAVDPVDTSVHMTAIESIRERGVPVKRSTRASK